ncbi:N-glycosylase [Candidatus Pacearchaeota archaeon CG10_big_fil_rev_8_21_14_0_10_32_14]|nr:MAG: N-glycosylase [Candidatus Pacearchaeota archaeon CG10_big_fil_rev_8_21_14_0_10_32_14]
MEIIDIKDHHSNNKVIIQNRLNEFSEIIKRNNEKEIFRELCFCILTAGASAELGIKTIDHIGDVIYNGTQEEIVSKLKEVYRFYNLRGNYIFLARNNFDIKVLNLPHIERRDEIVKRIKGIGYKEASHFLRNIGYKDYAILDKHILNCLHEAGILENNKPPKNRNRYLEIEETLRNFSKELGIDFDELDLVLWSLKTGKVLK